MRSLCYDTDLSDVEWAILAPLLAPTTRRGRPRKHDLRRVLNAILYILRGGEPWRLLPHEFPPWQSVYDHFRRWRHRGTWRSINDALRTQARLLAGRSPELDLHRTSGELCMKQEDLHAEDPFYERVPG